MGRLKYKGYEGNVDYSEEDNSFVGTVQGLRHACIIYEGDSVETLKKDFEESIDLYLKTCRDRGEEPEKPFSGKLIVRMNSTLHSAATEKAQGMGISLNEFIKRAIQVAVL